MVADALQSVISRRNAVTAFDVRAELRQNGNASNLNLDEVGPCLREWWNMGHKVFNGFACKKAGDDTIANHKRALIFFKVPKSC